MSLERLEQETITCFNEEEGHAEVWTSCRSIAERLIRAGIEPQRKDSGGWHFEVPKHSIIIEAAEKSIRLAGPRDTARKRTAKKQAAGL